MNVLGNFFRIGEKFPMKVLFCIQDFSFPTIRPKGWKPFPTAPGFWNAAFCGLSEGFRLPWTGCCW